MKQYYIKFCTDAFNKSTMYSLSLSEFNVLIFLKTLVSSDERYNIMWADLSACHFYNVVPTGNRH